MVNLSNDEFLSLYTGYLLSRDFDVVVKAEEKVFGFAPYTLTTVECAKQFRDYIDKNRPDLVEAVEELGEFQKDENQPIMRQVEAYVKRFEDITQSKVVEVEKLKFKSNAKTKDLEDNPEDTFFVDRNFIKEQANKERELNR